MILAAESAAAWVLIVVALIGAAGTLGAAMVNARAARRRRSLATLVPLVLTLGVLGGIYLAPRIDPGTDPAQGGPSTTVPRPPLGRDGGAVLPREEPDGEDAEAARCPTRAQFERADELGGGDFVVEGIPESGSRLVLQMEVQGDGEPMIITLCEDGAGEPWYFSRWIDSATTGALAPAVAVGSAFHAPVEFANGTVTFSVTAAGVTTSENDVLGVRGEITCATEDVAARLGLDDPVDACTEDVVEPWLDTP